jgi:hypothetical protein
MTEDNSEDSFDKVKKGLKETAEGVKEGVEDTVEGIKEGVEETARESTDPYTKLYENTENREYNKAGGNEPMNPENIASHEPTAVKRDQDTEITEGQTGTDSAEAKEKYRKKGMTET